MKKRIALALALAVMMVLTVHVTARAQSNRQATGKSAAEDVYYHIKTLPLPEGMVLEVGGLALLPNGSLAVSTRRGEIWIVENPYMTGTGQPRYRLYASGLHEPLGLAYRDNAIYATQRGEITRMMDVDEDGRADVFETVYAWPLSGNYHEYSYGPVFRPDGTMLVTLNLAWVGKGASLVPWRGWTLEITPDGKMTPFATGMRSPAGFFLTKEGDFFYSENQGDWVGSGRITHVERGDFVGNPEGLRWTSEPGSPLKLTAEDVPDTGEPLFDVAKRVDALKPPAVWLPHGILGISTSGILQDTVGTFGPFEGQFFVGDQGHSKIFRMALEKVDGVYQGAVFPFREGFASGVLRLAWGSDGSMFVGQTSRGWDATGRAPYALQRLVWTGETPFEARTISARPDGFEIEFTRPADVVKAADPASYEVTSFTYKYHHEYGSPVINQESLPVRHVQVSEDGLRARLVVDGLREGYIHEIKMAGVMTPAGEPLLHDTGYYTLNRIPEGQRLAVARTGGTPEASARPEIVAVSAQAGGSTRPSGEIGPQAKRLTEMPTSWEKVDVTITLKTLPGMKYDLPSFEVKPGARVRLVFNNDDDMLHNVVIVKPGTADKVGQDAVQLGLRGAEMNWVPESDDVLYYTALLQPETSESIYFTAPATPGDYTYVCTFPGHYISMRGTMRVAP